MQIALTKKLSEAVGVKPAPANAATVPLFMWTANWINTFDRRKEDMVVLVNAATRFTVSIYGVKRNQFVGIANKITAAIRNTLLAMNLNAELVDEYLRRAGEVEFCANKDRKMTACVNHSGLEAAVTVGRAVNESGGKIKYNDTLGYAISRRPVNYSNSYADCYIPAEEMVRALAVLTGKPAFRYRAFALLVTLDLEIYKATRRIIVPADIEMTNLHEVLQCVFGWKNCHLHDFTVFDGNRRNPIARIVMSEEDLGYDSDAVLEEGRRLSDYFPQYKYMRYTYDMGDSWKHEIELVSVMEEHGEESPYLLEAIGQTPPEDVGGVGGFLDFREIMLDPTHPNFAETKEWVGYWSPELREWDTKPKVIRW